MKNFIRKNIDNVRGGGKAHSIQKQSKIQRKSPYKNTPSIVYSGNQPTLNGRLVQIERKLQEVQVNNQTEIMEQLFSIKEDIKVIKSHIFDRHRSSSYHHDNHQQRQVTFESNHSDQQNIYNSGNQRMKSQSSENQKHEKHFYRSTPHNKIVTLEQMLNQRIKRSHNTFKGNGISIKNIYSMVKDYKVETPEFGSVFFGYSKRNSQEVAIKYCPDGCNHILEIYDRLWKNIASAKWPCVNRILDFKRDDSSVFMMERNKGSIVGLPAKSVIIDILRALEFIHDSGYLYRNIQPQHFMLNENGQLVIIDFKRTKRYIDIKGHQLEVVNSFNGSPFSSNNQIRGLPQSRKDDLESLGYFALLLMEMEIPWLGCSKQMTIKLRSTMTLQEIYKNNKKWIEFMVIVMKTGKHDRPDYKRLLEILEIM